LVFEFSHILFSLFKFAKGARVQLLALYKCFGLSQKFAKLTVARQYPSLHWPGGDFVQVRFIDPQSQPRRNASAKNAQGLKPKCLRR
jgi:hypothetical protein